MTAVLAHRTITAVALAEQRLRASGLSPGLQPSPRSRPARPQALARRLIRPVGRLRRRAGMGLVTVGLRLVLGGDDLDAA